MFKSTLLVTILSSLLIICNSQGFLDSSTNHLGVCYNSTEYTLDRLYPAQSLDNLLAIIEKIESHTSFQSKSADYIAAYLLKRFRIDGIIYKPAVNNIAATYTTEKEEWKRGRMVLSIISHKGAFEFDDVKFLTDEEKCSLHWMLSHSLNETVLQEEHNDPNWRPTPAPWNVRRKRQYPNNERRERSHYPREMGIIYTPNSEAIAAGSLLAGIAFLNDVSPTIYFRDLIVVTDQSLRDKTLKHFDAVTYALNLALPATQDAQNPLLGPKGFWNDSTCPTEYTLQSPATRATDAVIFGSFDGYFIGKAFVGQQNHRVKLSQILRMYYGNGFPFDRETRACNRIKKIQKFFSGDEVGGVQFQLENAILLMALDIGTGPMNVDASKAASEKILEGLRVNYTENRYSPGVDCINLDGVTTPEINPMIDLYVVMDGRFLQDKISYDSAARFVNHVANFLDIGANSSHIGLYVDDKKLFSEFFPLNETMSEAEWKCKVKRYEPKFFSPSEDTIQTIHSLKQMFLELKRAERERMVLLTPGRVVLFLRSTSVNDYDKVVWEMEMFRKDHPEIKILGAGKNHGDLRAFVPDKKDFISFSLGVNEAQTAKTFYKENLEKIGATIYNPKCEYKETRNNAATGFLAPYSRQYLKIPSQMFNLSTDFKIDFKAAGISLTVCWSRSEDIFRFSTSNKDKCHVAASSGQTVNIYFGDPCSGYSAGSCAPIYLQVSRSDMADSNFSPCNNEKGLFCRTYEHTRFDIRLDNAFCSGCSIKLALHLLAACLAITVFGKLF